MLSARFHRPGGDGPHCTLKINLIPPSTPILRQTVSGFWFQSGFGTESTSSVVIWDTGSPRIGAA